MAETMSRTVVTGCCVDRECKPETCMRLPPGLTCGACVHDHRCAAMFGISRADTTCDFFPRRFQSKRPAPPPGPAPDDKE